MPNQIACIAGLCGAGKSVVSQYFIQAGFQYVHIGKITLDILKERELAINETNERRIREELRQKHGMAAYALLNLDKIEKLSLDHHVVADGLYSFSEYQVFKKHFTSRCCVVAVYAPPELRYQRLMMRPDRPLSPEESQERDFSEIQHLEKGGPIAMADITLLNTQDFEYIEKQCKEAIDAIQRRK